MADLNNDVYFEIDQAVLFLGEDWMLDYDGVYEATEEWISERPDEALAQLVGEVDQLFALTPDMGARLRMFRTGYAFSPRNDGFDVWLRALQRRATEALAGVHSNPLVDADAHPDENGRS